MTEKNCGNCDVFVESEKKVFCGDGFCHLRQSKPVLVSKTLCCKFWIRKKQSKQED